MHTTVTWADWVQSSSDSVLDNTQGKPETRPSVMLQLPALGFVQARGTNINLALDTDGAPLESGNRLSPNTPEMSHQAPDHGRHRFYWVFAQLCSTVMLMPFTWWGFSSSFCQVHFRYWSMIEDHPIALTRLCLDKLSACLEAVSCLLMRNGLKGSCWCIYTRKVQV